MVHSDADQPPRRLPPRTKSAQSGKQARKKSPPPQSSTLNAIQIAGLTAGGIALVGIAAFAASRLFRSPADRILAEGQVEMEQKLDNAMNEFGNQFSKAVNNLEMQPMQPVVNTDPDQSVPRGDYDPANEMVWDDPEDQADELQSQADAFALLESKTVKAWIGKPARPAFEKSISRFTVAGSNRGQTTYRLKFRNSNDEVATLEVVLNDRRIEKATLTPSGKSEILIAPSEFTLP